MTPVLLYIARASLYLALFYAFYLLVMRKTSLFRFNRIALLLGTVLCHLLPMLRLRTVLLPESIPVPVESFDFQPAAEPVGASAAPFPWLTVVYAAGVLAVLALVLISLGRTRRIIRRGVTQPCEDCRLTLVDGDIPSFSWGRHVVMSRSDYEKYPAILGHELQHIRCRHSLDVVLMTAVNAVHWFNPLVWIARAELKLLHEYEADEGLIQKGIDVTQYQLLLVRKAVGEQRFSLANGFNHAKLKQRITMMHKPHTPGRVRFAYAAVLPILAATMFVCNPVRARIVSSPQNPPAEAANYASIEKKPTFQGGDANTFSKWVSMHINYPEAAKKSGTSGRVMVAFVIGKDGSVGNVKVLRGVDPVLDAEAVRVISASPKWEPGIQDGKPVDVSFMFPVIFQVRGGNQPTPSADAASDAPKTSNELEDVVVISYAEQPANTFPVNGHIILRNGEGGIANPLIYLDGEKYAGKINDIDPATIASIEVLKDEAAIEKYGEEARNGVLLIKTKKQ